MWTGPTCCSAGSCHFYNPWYSQCLQSAVPAATTTTTAATAGSSEETCSSLYGQCGGEGWSGSTCCSVGSCIYFNQWFSQCLQTSGDESDDCAQKWGQCGGQTWTGPTCCSSSTCTYFNPWYSQCLESVATTSTPSSGENPYADSTWYVTRSFSEFLGFSISSDSNVTVKSTLETMQNIPTAFWIDQQWKIQKNNLYDDANTVEGILEDASSCSPPSLVTFVVYNLPNRDCYSSASMADICCHRDEDSAYRDCVLESSGSTASFYKEVAESNCADGLKEYEENFINPLVEMLLSHSEVPVVLILEPGALESIVTKKGEHGCHQETAAAYLQGVSIAVEKLSTTGATIYVDAGHGGSLGFAAEGNDKAGEFVSLIAEMGIASKIRGFATNVGHSQPIGTTVCSVPGLCEGGGVTDDCCRDDPCGLQQDGSWGHNEVNYIDVLDQKVQAAISGFRPQFLIDTGRSGNPSGRQDCSIWCNARGNGIGHVPTLNTPDSRIDAYLWIKPPGFSDGCTEITPDEVKCRRADEDCSSIGSIGSLDGEPRAPEAGRWFHHQITMLVENAAMGDTSEVRTCNHGRRMQGRAQRFFVHRTHPRSDGDRFLPPAPLEISSASREAQRGCIATAILGFVSLIVVDSVLVL